MLMPFAAYASTGENKLRELLGQMPERKPLQIDTLESVKLEDGIRYKIRYFLTSSLRHPKHQDGQTGASATDVQESASSYA